MKRILTSRRFVAQARLEDLIEDLSHIAAVTYLEDIRRQIGPADKAYAALAGAFPRRFAAKASPDDVGVILFTSGSFGAPKGVVLSQSNLLSNVAQVAAHIELDPDWVWFNPLPAFHSFGLTGGMLLPLIFSGGGRLSLDHLIARLTHAPKPEPVHGPQSWALAALVLAIPFLMLLPWFGAALLLASLACALAARRVTA